MGNMPVVDVGGRKVRVKRLLSEGGYAHVYKAIDEVNKKEYALKMVRIPRGRSGQIANEEVAEMAVMEQSVVRSLPTNHPNIVRFHDAGIGKAENEIRYYILSEYCPSNVVKKMSNVADQGKLLPEKEVLLIFRDTLMAVLHLHSRHPPIAHRDLKVENLLVGRDGQVKLCDFGSCSTTHRAYHGPKDIQSANEDIRRNTTLPYRSPEQVDLFKGQVISEKVDIWALGVILYKLAFFQTPFEDNKGYVDTGAILKGMGDRKITQEKRYSGGLVSLIKCCLVLDPERRPSIGQVLKLCEELHESDSLPEWPGLKSLPRTPPHSSSSPFSPQPWDIMGDMSGSDGREPNRGLNGGGGDREGRSGGGGYTSGERDCQAGGGGGGGGGNNAHSRNGLPRSNSRRSGQPSGIPTPSSDSNKGTGGSPSVTASPRRSQMITRTHTGSGDTSWMGRVGDGVRSKWYKLMGAVQRKRLWVLKTTSQNATGPKPKYVGKLVAALWEKDLTMGSVFMLLRDRPMAESPVVAMKALVTVMKLLQQGPPEVLMECTTYAPVVEEIGQMWGPNNMGPTASILPGGAGEGSVIPSAGADNSGGGPASGSGGSGSGGTDADPRVTLDPALSRLIMRLATMIVKKIRFHEHHPEYVKYWSPETGNDTDTTPTTHERTVQERLPAQDVNDEPRTLKVISNLLGLQECIISTMTEAFLLLSKGAKDAGPSTRSALLPLMAESYLTYFATTRVLLTVSEKYSGGLRRGKPRPENLVTMSRQYEVDLKLMRELYKRAEEVEEVAIMKRTPRLPAVSPLSEGGAKQFREMSRKSSRQSTFGRASSKMEALKTLRDEERTFVDSNRSRQGTGANMLNSDDEEDDGASDNDVEMDGSGNGSGNGNGNNLVIGEDGFFGGAAADGKRGKRSISGGQSGYGQNGGSGGGSGLDSGSGRRLIRVPNDWVVVSVNSDSSTPGAYGSKGHEWGDHRAFGEVEGSSPGAAIKDYIEGRNDNDGNGRGGVEEDDGDDDDDDDASSGWGGEREQEGDRVNREASRRWTRPPKDLRLEVSNDCEWNDDCTARGPIGRAPSSRQAQDHQAPVNGAFGVRRRLRQDRDGRVMAAWSTVASEAEPSGGRGSGVISFPTHPSPRHSSAEYNAAAVALAAATASVAATTSTIAMTSREGGGGVSSGTGLEPNGAGRARGGADAGGSSSSSRRGTNISLAEEDQRFAASAPRKPPDQGAAGGGGSVEGRRKTEDFSAEQAPSSAFPRGDARREQVGGAPISDFETLTLGGGDRAAPSVLTTEGAAAHQIPLTIGREPSALKRERSQPPPLPPRRDYEGSPTAAAGDVDAMAYDADAAVDWNDSAGAGAGTAPPLPPRGALVEPLTVGGGGGAVRRKEAYPGASPSRRRGSGALQQQQKQKQEVGGPPPPVPSPRLIKGGFGPPNAGPLSWTDAKTGGDRRRGAASAAATSNARVTGNSNYSQQQQQKQHNQRHSGRHNRTVSDASTSSSSVAASAAAPRVATSASPSKPRRARATSGNVGLGGAGRVAAAGPVAVGVEQQQPAAGGGMAVAAGGGVCDAGVAGGGGAGGSGGGAGVAMAGTGRVAVAKYEYTAQGPEQLSFRVGDTVHLHTDKVNAKGWGLGQANGKVGWFPGDFVDMRPSSPVEKRSRPSGAPRGSAGRTRRPHLNPAAGGVEGGGVGGRSPAQGQAAGQGQGQAKGTPPPPPPYPGRNQQQQQQQQRTTRGGGGGGGGGNDQHHQAGAQLYREADHWGTERERARAEGGGGRQPEQLPEHVFAMQMAKNQPWKDRLTPGGKAAYDDLLAFFKASRMVLDFDAIELKSVIGSGAFATVFRGILRHRVGRPGEEVEQKMEVAVKKLVGGGGGPMEKTLKDFKLECVMLSRLKHRNIIALVGATTHPVTCVMQYCSRGNLMVLLDDRSIDITSKMKKQIMLDVATGMRYLHGQNPVIIHRDLKSLNVLIDESWVTKVTDFGLSRFKATSVSEKMTGQAGTYHWMAPEVINSLHYTEKADVFSYGIILWEIFTRAIPYGGMQPVQVVAAVLGRRERPHIPPGCPPALSQLMKACWTHEPDQRPSFDDIVPWLESL